MRVVAGSAGGRRLRAPEGRQLRPTSERVREAVFNALGSLDLVAGATVLDLFAGTGALAIEALSRGASSATLVEADSRAVAAIRANLEATGMAAQARVVHADVFRFLADRAASPADLFDVALADPPYAFTAWERLLAAVPARVVALEAGTHVDLGRAWVPLRSRRYGDTVVTLARRHATEVE